MENRKWEIIELVSGLYCVAGSRSEFKWHTPQISLIAESFHVSASRSSVCVCILNI